LIASTGFAVLTPKRVPWTFLHVALTQPEVFDGLGHLADGGAYPAIRAEVIGALRLVVPGESKLLDAFHSISTPLYEKAHRNRQEVHSLAVLRDSLLPRLLSGEIRIQDVARIGGSST
jgi:type I restriction enzyme S subunit